MIAFFLQANIEFLFLVKSKIYDFCFYFLFIPSAVVLCMCVVRLFSAKILMMIMIVWLE